MTQDETVQVTWPSTSTIITCTHQHTEFFASHTWSNWFSLIHSKFTLLSQQIESL